MSSDAPASSQSPPPITNGTSFNPSNTTLRHRGSSRTLTNNEQTHPAPTRRRSSFLSENLSETHKSFRSSTDDLLLPRVRALSQPDDMIETSYWHSLPLGLALLPAVGGLFFNDGSAIVTDITLLGLAAIFLNWALRLPWEWYHSAQSTTIINDDIPSTFEVIEEEDDVDLEMSSNPKENSHVKTAQAPQTNGSYSSLEASSVAAQSELRLHEITALLACFLMPVLGAWLLHGIRSQLSRPSEGLVSNYNLTIFLLVAELRPLSHLMKMVQQRTLFLQRRVNSNKLREQMGNEKHIISDLSNRIEELETHVADAAVSSPAQPAVENTPEHLVAKASVQATSDLRNSIQPDLDALNRAMRRYEKRMTISAIQVEARLQDLETRLKDVVVLAAAAQRSVDTHPRNYAFTLANWLSALVVVPARLAVSMLTLPSKVMQMVFWRLKVLLNISQKQRDARDLKSGQRQPATRPRSTLKKPKASI